MALLSLGNGTLNADWNQAVGKRSYVILKYRDGVGYTWGKVFVSDAYNARLRVMAPRLKHDGWLFAYMGGNWVKVVGTQ